MTKSVDILSQYDIRVDSPVFSFASNTDLFAQQPCLGDTHLLRATSSLANLPEPDMSIILPIWFTSPCLLESLICIPARTTSIAASAVVRLLRAQGGFETEGSVVAGMDEARRLDSIGLIDLGLEMVESLGVARPASLKQVLTAWPSDFALQMLELSMKPMANRGLLIGLSWAFVDMHEAMVSSTLLSPVNRAALSQISHRERECLKMCFDELKDEKVHRDGFWKGYVLGMVKVRSCFGIEVHDGEEGLSEKLW